jgi:hypothetical protein
MPPIVPSLAYSDNDLKALQAQVMDGVPWRDGVLTAEQASALVTEVLRLRRLVSEKDAMIVSLSRRNEHLVGILS